ncbi:MAG: ion channel [Bacteroidota bacterium]
MPFQFNSYKIKIKHIPFQSNGGTLSPYTTAITFFDENKKEIGYGDYYPEGIIRWLCGLEGFVGLFLMSYFTVAFVRKILR